MGRRRAAQPGESLNTSIATPLKVIATIPRQLIGLADTARLGWLILAIEPATPAGRADSDYLAG